MSNKYRFCPKCGQQLLINAKFCHNCGANLNEEFKIPANIENIDEVDTKIEDGLDIPFVGASKNEAIKALENKEVEYIEEEIEENIEDEDMDTIYGDDDDDEDEEELETESRASKILTRILTGIVALLIVVLIIITAMFFIKTNNIKLPFFNTNKQAEVSESELTKKIKAYLSENGNDVTKVESLYIDGENILINNSLQPTSGEKVGSYDLNDLKDYPNLKKIIVNNVNSLVFAKTDINAVEELELLNSIADPSLDGIQNFTNLKSLKVVNSSFASVDNIAKLSKLEFLTLDGNGLNTIGGLEKLSNLKNAAISNNNISDYSPIERLNPQNNSKPSTKPNTISDNIDGKKVEILISDLRVRTSPSIQSDNNIIENDKTVLKGAILPVYEEKQAEGFTWYRIGDHKWIASKEGEWTKIIN